MVSAFLRGLSLSTTVAFAALFVAACGSPPDATKTSPMGADAGGAGGGTCVVSPTFSSIRAHVLATASCAVNGCHATLGQAGLSFDGDPNVVYQSLVGAPSHTSTFKRVAPNAPGESFLFLKVSEDVPPTGSRMPVGSKTLSACEIDAIRDWIAAGAAKD